MICLAFVATSIFRSGRLRLGLVIYAICGASVTLFLISVRGFPLEETMVAPARFTLWFYVSQALNLTVLFREWCHWKVERIKARQDDQALWE